MPIEEPTIQKALIAYGPKAHIVCNVCNNAKKDDNNEKREKAYKLFGIHKESRIQEAHKINAID